MGLASGAERWCFSEHAEKPVTYEAESCTFDFLGQDSKEE